MPVSAEWLARQALQLPVPGFREAADRLAGARLRVVGAGEAAAPALRALLQAGIGKLWVEDPAPAGAAGGWLGTAAEGDRAAAACAALAQASRLSQVEPYPVGGVPTATLVCAASAAEALAAAEQARRARVPHAVVEPDGEGGAVVVVPPGGPCYACARSPGVSWRPPTPRGLPLACLAAVELLLALVRPEDRAGRRVELVRGIPRSYATRRREACACGRGAGP